MRSCILSNAIDHFTVVCLVACPLNESEAGVDLALIEQNFGFIKRVDKGEITTVKDLES